MTRLKVLYGIFAIMVVALVIFSYAAATSLAPVIEQAQAEDTDTNVVIPAEVEQAPAVEPVSIPTAPADTAAPEPVRDSDVPHIEQGGHIPFTSQPVTPGQPETYVDTVGQCPFYEMGGPKGCIPPADIECNADWTVCTKKEL